MSLVRFRPEAPTPSAHCAFHAGVAHLVERHLAKVEVASSSLVARSKKEVTTYVVTSFLDSGRKLKCSGEVNSPSAKVLLRKTLVRRKSVVFCFGRLNRYGTSELGVLFFYKNVPCQCLKTGF